MKILVRQWNDEGNKTEYVWKQVSNKPNSIRDDEFKTIDGHRYHELDILKISRDSRKIYGYCRNCGKLVKHGDEEKHFAEVEKNINCFDCRYMSASATGKFLKRKYVLQEDGTYMKTVKEEVSVYCCAGYHNKTIEKAKEEKSAYCPHFKCRHHGVVNYSETLFMKYPKMYEIFATEKSLIDNKFTLDHMNNNHTRNYESKRFKNLKAVVDDNGLIIKFIYWHRGYDYNFIYAKAYDKFFTRTYRGYENGLNWNMSSTTKENIMKLVRNIYADVDAK